MNVSGMNVSGMNVSVSSAAKCRSYSSINFEGSDLAQSFVETAEECCEACGKT